MSASKLKEYRLAAKLSQREAAERLNVSSGSLSTWELGKFEPSFKILCAMADLYRCSVDELLGRASPEKKEPALENPEDRLPQIETEILTMWRTMTEEQRVALVTAAFQIINKSPRDPQ